MRVSQLPDQLGASQRSFLYCTKCGAEYSANRGDYFTANPDTVIRCCRRVMLLVTAQRVLTEVAA